ncbi:hypothetical protein SEA_HIRKO_75 [Arthrobacter phage Hirko]|nr:hypothetical protein SEA_HIRKO_75 [Arthrobacter phage Hirko]
MPLKKSDTERGELETALAVAAFVVIAVLCVIGSLVWNGTKQTMTCTVTEKQATAKKDSGTRYLIYTENCGQLEVADSLLNLKFNSADTYGGIKPGQSYTFHTVGWRNGLFSQFPNILDAEQ